MNNEIFLKRGYLYCKAKFFNYACSITYYYINIFINDFINLLWQNKKYYTDTDVSEILISNKN